MFSPIIYLLKFVSFLYKRISLFFKNISRLYFQTFKIFSSSKRVHKNLKGQIFMMNFKHLNLNKFRSKGQIFMMDLIFSFVILIVALGIASIYYSEVSNDDGLYEFTQDSLNRITTTSINSLNSPEIRNLFVQGKINNIENSIAQQVSIFYENGDLELARNVTRIYFENTEGNQYFMNISLINTTNSYSLYSSPVIRVSYEESKVSYAMSREVIAFTNRSQIIGPYTFQIILWQ